jgi:hypothetical protein
MKSMSQIKLSLPGASKIAHLFVDASNVNVPAHEIPALDAIARSGFARFGTAFVVGSTEGPSPKPAIWESLDYKVKWSQRHGQAESEFNVDTTIVAAMMEDILVHRDASNRVMVLLSGDGNANEGLPSFRSAVQHALSHGWAVKIVSFKPSSVYLALQQQFPRQLQIQTISPQQVTQAAGGAAPATKVHQAPRTSAKSRSRTPSPPASSPLVYCSFFAAGNCRYGDACKKLHVIPPHATPAVLELSVPQHHHVASRQCGHHQTAIQQSDSKKIDALMAMVLHGNGKKFTMKFNGN